MILTRFWQRVSSSDKLWWQTSRDQRLYSLDMLGSITSTACWNLHFMQRKFCQRNCLKRQLNVRNSVLLWSSVQVDCLYECVQILGLPKHINESTTASAMATRPGDGQQDSDAHTSKSFTANAQRPLKQTVLGGVPKQRYECPFWLWHFTERKSLC